MVHSVTIGAVVLTAMAALGAGRIAQSAREEARYGVCQDYASRSQAKAADHLVSAAARDLASAQQGGSLYAVSKVGVQTDPAAIASAQARLASAQAARTAAFGACAR